MARAGQTGPAPIFFFNDTATTEIYTLALHDALPIFVLTTPPSSTARSGQALAQQPAVQLQDANGNPVSQSNVVVTATPSPAGATASNNTATTGTTGAATFSGLTLSGTAGDYTLSFRGGGLTPATSRAIALGAGPAAAVAPHRGRPTGRP